MRPCPSLPLPVFLTALTLAPLSLLTAQTKVDFAHDVLPLLQEHCAKCHTDGTYKGGFSMDTREAVLDSEHVVPGNSAASDLITLLRLPDAEDRMPQKAEPLSDHAVATLSAWIDAGLPWEPGFSFKETAWQAPLALTRPELPPAGSLGSHPIDRLVDLYFSQEEITPPPRLPDALFYRRLSLDLLGLLPAPADVEAFVADQAPDKHRRLIDRLLDRRVDYADHWLSFWNDLLRNDYQGTGFIDGGREQITAWLYQALLENKPYDVFARELISPQPASAGFIKGIQWRGNVNASQRREVQFAQNVSQVFLGENMKCASCHDSFINDWKLSDAYGLAAIVAESPLEIHRCDKPTGEFARPQFPFPSLGSIDPAQPKESRLQQTAALMTSPANGRFPRTLVNRLWQRLLGRGLVEPVDMMGNRPWDEPLLDYLAAFLADSNFDVKKTLALIVSSQTYRSATVERHQGTPEEYRFRGPVAKRLTAEQFIDGVWTLTGQAPEKVAAEGAAELPRSQVRASLITSTTLMRALGRPNREQIVTVRPEDLSTLQALELNNGSEFDHYLNEGAQSLSQRFADQGPEALISHVFQHAFSRRPSDEEKQHCRQLLGDSLSPQGAADLLWTVFLSPEFQIIH